MSMLIFEADIELVLKSTSAVRRKLETASHPTQQHFLHLGQFIIGHIARNLRVTFYRSVLSPNY